MLHELQQPQYEDVLICLGVALGIAVIYFVLVFGTMGIVMSLMKYFDRDKPRATDRHD